MPKPYELRLRPGRAWLRLDWAGLVEYRDLLVILVQRDFSSRYRQTVLGPAWFVLQPLVTTLAFTLVFHGVLKTPTDGVPPFLFYLCGMLGWGCFSSLFTATGGTFGANAGLFTKVYFPRLIIPLATAASGLVTFVVQLATFLLVYAQHLATRPAGAALHVCWPALASLPLVVLFMVLLALGAGLATSALSAKYRDLQHAVPFAVQTLMYVTPVVFPLSQLPPHLHWLATLNPMATGVELFRLAFFGVGTVSAAGIALAVALTLVVAAVGLALFQRAERTFADSI